MKKKIAIIGAGLFGLTTYIVLKQKGYDCSLFEKNKKILNGASTNNLNRVHFGYHYPRDIETVKQSLKGYKSFKDFYLKSIVKNFDNYYFLANKSKINFKKYLEFCDSNKLKYQKLDLKNFRLETKNIQGGIKIKEPIYDWKIIEEEIVNKLRVFKKNKIYLNEKVLDINFKRKCKLTTSKKKYIFDKIIDASYQGSNEITKNFFKEKKLIYQITAVFEFVSKNFNKMGICLMDGDYFSFLARGGSKKHIIYDVSESILKNKLCDEFPEQWKNKKINTNLLKKRGANIIEKMNKYFPDLNIKLTGKYFLSSRIFKPNEQKTDKRISTISLLNNDYIKIFSAKVDHCVDIANQINKVLTTLKS